MIQRNNPIMKPTRNFWPLGVTLAFLVFATGTTTLVVIACAHKTDLVTPDYYEQEIKFQGRLDQLNRTAQLSERVNISYDKATRRITIALPVEHASLETTGQIQLYRPSATGLDRELKLELDAGGAQSVDASSLLPGLWKIRVQWTVSDRNYFTDQSVFVGRAS